MLIILQKHILSLLNFNYRMKNYDENILRSFVYIILIVFYHKICIISDIYVLEIVYWENNELRGWRNRKCKIILYNQL